ncbi:YndM family protein [Paenibacillus sp. MZ04-78.2]|uniref:DUF2512 family protein n=1 Tax=Paenibacillus sp. MZ04-78.2 TaxID=2962034 RepID=UPI0020B8FEF7|nr:DUF2512 family protein [Paenibacillus sp. MZ04-78.2]MCP3775795.1 YndM family protein [Paenibacillus sp. MZ04-78.2]
MKFIVKLLLNGIVVVPLLMWFSEATLLQAVITALVLSIIAYLVGDQWILKVSNNTVATAADAVLSFAVLWMAARWMNWDLSFMEMIIISLVLGVVEVFFHRFLGTVDDRTAAKQ